MSTTLEEFNKNDGKYTLLEFCTPNLVSPVCTPSLISGNKGAFTFAPARLQPNKQRSGINRPIRKTYGPTIKDPLEAGLFNIMTFRFSGYAVCHEGIGFAYTVCHEGIRFFAYTACYEGIPVFVYRLLRGHPGFAYAACHEGIPVFAYTACYAGIPVVCRLPRGHPVLHIPPTTRSIRFCIYRLHLGIRFCICRLSRGHPGFCICRLPRGHPGFCICRLSRASGF